MSSVPRRVHDEKEARVLLDRQRRSGSTLSAWCRTEGIKAHSLAWWRTHLAEPGLHIVEVTPTAAAPVPRSSARYILHLGDLAIEVSDDFQEATLSRLLAMVVPC